MKVQFAITLADFRVRHGVDEVVTPHNHGATVVELMAKAISSDAEEVDIHPLVLRGLEQVKTLLAAYAAKRAAEGWSVTGVEFVPAWETHDEAFARRCATMKSNWDKVSLEDLFSKDTNTQSHQALRLMGLR